MNGPLAGRLAVLCFLREIRCLSLNSATKDRARKRSAAEASLGRTTAADGSKEKRLRRSSTSRGSGKIRGRSSARHPGKKSAHSRNISPQGAILRHGLCVLPLRRELPRRAGVSRTPLSGPQAHVTLLGQNAATCAISESSGVY